MSVPFRTTTDASSVYRERTSVIVARSYSSSETGNLAAVTKDSTFVCDDAVVPEAAHQVPSGPVLPDAK
jgi:hypothetical protein